MRIGIGFTMILFLLTSCKYFRGDHCNNTKSIVGTYENIYDEKADNILQIYEDGTFEQTFTKKGIVKKNKGTWRESPTKNCYVLLKGLKVLHDLHESEEKYFTDLAVHRFDDLLFFEDMGYVFDFYRVD